MVSPGEWKYLSRENTNDYPQQKPRVDRYRFVKAKPSTAAYHAIAHRPNGRTYDVNIHNRIRILPCLVQGVERFNKALRLVISGDDEGDHGGEFAATP